MRAPVVVWRLLRTVAHALRGWWTIRTRFPRIDQDERDALVTEWARAMLRILGVELRVQGEPAAHGPMLFVCNHISWLDILVIHAARHCRFVSKADVKHWPLVGTLATGAGTLYIERESRRDAMRVVHHMTAALRAGDVLAVFPEGTTSAGEDLLPFHANLMQSAISAEAPVQPMALAYIDPATGALSQAARYVGDDSLAWSLWQTLGARGLRAVVRFGLPGPALGRDRRTWALALREEVAQLRLQALADGGHRASGTARAD